MSNQNQGLHFLIGSRAYSIIEVQIHRIITYVLIIIYLLILCSGPTATTTTVNMIKYVCNVNFIRLIMVAGQNSCGKESVLRY